MSVPLEMLECTTYSAAESFRDNLVRREMAEVPVEQDPEPGEFSIRHLPSPVAHVPSLWRFHYRVHEGNWAEEMAEELASLLEAKEEKHGETCAAPGCSRPPVGPRSSLCGFCRERIKTIRRRYRTNGRAIPEVPS